MFPVKVVTEAVPVMVRPQETWEEALALEGYIRKTGIKHVGQVFCLCLTERKPVPVDF